MPSDPLILIAWSGTFAPGAEAYAGRRRHANARRAASLLAKPLSGALQFLTGRDD